MTKKFSNSLLFFLSQFWILFWDLFLAVVNMQREDKSIMKKGPTINIQSDRNKMYTLEQKTCPSQVPRAGSPQH